MSAIARAYTFTDGTDAFGSQVENEFTTVFNAWNNADAATTTWTNVKVATLLSTTSTTLKGTATNDAAATGNVGEYVESITTTTTAASGTYGDVTSISLTAGDWELTAINYFNSGTTITIAITGISTTSGNSSTGLVAGSNQVVDVIAFTTHDYTQVVTGYRLSIAATTTVYLKESATYTGTFSCTARLSARRLR